MKKTSTALGLVAVACFLAAIWAPDHNLRWLITGALAVIIAGGVWGTYLSRAEQDRAARNREGGSQ